MSFLLSFSLPSPLLSPFSSLSYITELPIAFSLPSQDYSTSSEASPPLKGFISAQCLLAGLYNNSRRLALCPLSKPCVPSSQSILQLQAGLHWCGFEQPGCYWEALQQSRSPAFFVCFHVISSKEARGR